jgi:hypothetical protein
VKQQPGKNQEKEKEQKIKKKKKKKKHFPKVFSFRCVLPHSCLYLSA